VNVESRFSMRVFAFILPIRGSVDLDHRSLFLSSTNYRSAGATLWIAISDQCPWASNPRGWRTSWKVVSVCQRLTNQEMIRPGSVRRSVQSSV
jgi:hypothetical protein